MLRNFLRRIGEVLHPMPLSGFSESNIDIPRLANLSDADLAVLNATLPWQSFLIDSRGRRFGNRASSQKRNTPEQVPDRRIKSLHERFDLSDKKVFEVGCFEGSHTVALAQLAKRVVACDSRVEHLVKCLVRCWAFEVSPELHLWNVETDVPADLSLDCDVLHHVGVLYHLAHPVEHLNVVLPHVTKHVMLDTHVAGGETQCKCYPGFTQYQYSHFKEAGRAAAFAGMNDHAKWLRETDLIQLLHVNGFTTIDVAERRDERNGKRVLIYASRE